jgi:hypothetical protein
VNLVAALLPSALSAIPAEGRAALGCVVALAKGAHSVGPPAPPPQAIEGCRAIAGGVVPWELIAAAAGVAPGCDAADLNALVGAVVARGLVAGVVEWTGSRQVAGDVLFNFLVLLTRQLDAKGLDVLSGVFGGDSLP